MKSNLTINGFPLKKSFTFPGGETQIQIPRDEIDKAYDFQRIHKQFSIDIKTKIKNANDVIELLLVSEAVSHYYPSQEKNLTINYFPYARQDRRCNVGEANSFEWFVRLLINQEFSNIHYADIHNPAALRIIIDSYNYFIHTYFHELTSKDIFLRNQHILNGIDYLVAPDKGSVHKVRSISEHFNIPFIVANKIRDPESGMILSYEVQHPIKEDLHYMIIDDICDGGSTFIHLTNQLKKFNASTISLYVTHGIFSKGIEILYKSGIRHIITTDSYIDEDTICYADPGVTLTAKDYIESNYLTILEI